MVECSSFDLREVRSVLEFGVGTARLVRHLRSIEGVRLVGTDIDPELVRWCRGHVPGVEFHVNESAPPLPFAEGGAFNLAYAYSVFTHIPLELQRPWLEEMHRVLRPGGVFVCTVLGSHYEQL